MELARFLLLMGLLCIAASVLHAADSRALDIAVPPEALLNEAQLQEYRAAAIHGDPDAALRVADYYAMFKNDIIESNFWLQLAAEQGNCGATKTFLGRVQHLPYLSAASRVEYWETRERTACAAKETGNR